jgi:hypothetical protein
MLLIWGSRKAKYFFAVQLDNPNHVESAQQISFWAHAISKDFGRRERKASEKFTRFARRSKSPAATQESRHRAQRLNTRSSTIQPTGR